MCLDCSAVLLWFRARWSDAVTDKDLSLAWSIRQSPFRGVRAGSVTHSSTQSLRQWLGVCVPKFFFLFLNWALMELLAFYIISMCAFSFICTLLLSLHRHDVGGFGYLEQSRGARFDSHYFHHRRVLKWFEITFKCVVAIGSPPAVFGIYSTCRAELETPQPVS